MYILGVNPGHDATVVLLENGHLRAAVAEERLSRVKNHVGFPYRAIEECLRIAHVAPREVSVVAVPFLSYLQGPPYFVRFLLSRYTDGREDYVDSLPLDTRMGIAVEFFKKMITPGRVYWTSRSAAARRGFEGALVELGLTKARLVAYDHHTCHAASAYYTSGFDPCLIITIDGSGDGLSATASIGQGGEMKRIACTPFYASPGEFYSAITGFLGFRRLRHEGKVTGLAAFGDPSLCYAELEKCLALAEDGRRFYSSDITMWDQARYYAAIPFHLWTDTHGPIQVAKLLRCFSRRLGSFTPEDIAAGAQRLLEELTVRHVRTLIAETGLSCVAMAGGVFANVRVNQRVAEETGASRVFIHPNMGDGGAGLGAAFLAWKEVGRANGFTGERLEHVYLGPAYADEDIKRAAERLGLETRYTASPETAVAEYLAAKRVVGWFDGRMEYGPRALGSRSILADPMDRGINHWLNQRLHRTEFMPFAPSVLEEAAPRIFKNYGASAHPARFMTITFTMENEWRERTPAVCHVDGTARPHVVNKAENPRYYRLLQEYERLTGLPLLINTSFNIHEEPIVCTPEDALRSFLEGSVDVLAMGNFIIER